MNIEHYKGKEKKCPRCNSLFICYEKDISKCFCSKIELDSEILVKIKGIYSDCICEKCLKSYKKYEK